MDSAQRESLFEVDERGDLISYTDPEGAPHFFEYDTGHRLAAASDARGPGSAYHYGNGRIVETTSEASDEETRTRRFEPSALNGEVGAALAQGLGTLENPIPVVDDPVDLYHDGTGQVYRRESDLNGFPSAWEDPLGRIVEFTYNEHGKLLERTRPNGSVTEYQYDDGGRLTIVRELVNNSTIERQYDAPFQQISRYVDPLGRATDYRYSELGALEEIEITVDGEEMLTVFNHEDSRYPDRATTVVNALGESTAYTYDDHGNVATVTDALLRQTQYTYDAAGNISSRTDPRDETTAFTYNERNQLAEVLDSGGGLTEFRYAESGCGCNTDNLVAVIFPNDTSLTFEYDRLDRRTAAIDQLGRTSTYAYDPEGRLLEYVNQNQESMTYEYDGIGQLITKTLPGDETTTFSYDELGSLSSAVNAVSSLSFEYDLLGRLIASDQTIHAEPDEDLPEPIVSQLSYEYDKGGNLTTMEHEDRATT